MLAGELLFRDLIHVEEYKNLQVAAAESSIVSQETIDAANTKFRDLFSPVVDKAARVGKYARYLVEMALLAVWIDKSRTLYGPDSGQVLEEWVGGEYSLTLINHSIYEYIRSWTNEWLDEALMVLPGRITQRLCGYLVMLSEMGGDFELCKHATDKSLELSEGLVTEATPNGVPDVLAGFYERKGEEEKALHYYNMSLEGIKLAKATLKADAIVYRAALLTARLDSKQNALAIIGQYHPNFYGNRIINVMPARKLAGELAVKLADELGYDNVQEAVDTVLGYTSFQ